MVVYSFNDSRLNAQWVGFTLDWYRKLFANEEMLTAAGNSLLIGLVASLVSTVLGTMAGIAMYRYRLRLLPILVVAPIAIPEILMGVSLLIFFVLLNLTLGLVSIALAHIAFCIGFVAIVVRARLAGMDESLVEAARDCGATPLQAFRLVTLPLIMPGVIAGALMAFTLSIDDFVITFFTAGAGTVTLPLKIYTMVKIAVTPEVNAVSTLLMLLTLVLIVIASKLSPEPAAQPELGDDAAMKRSLARPVAAARLVACRRWPRTTLHLYNWNNYIAPETVERFEKPCKCKVKQTYYSDNEELLAKLAAGAKGYDVMVPTVQRGAGADQAAAAAAARQGKLPNLKNINPQYLNTEFDPGNKYSVPYAMSTTIIGYNDQKMKELGFPTDTWAVIFDPKNLEKIKGRVTVLDSPNELFAAALKYLGYSVNDTDEKHWKEAADLILKAKPYWAAFNASSYIKELTVGNIWLVHGYSQRHLPGQPRRAGGRTQVPDPAGHAEGRRGARGRQHGGPQGRAAARTWRSSSSTSCSKARTRPSSPT